ncbi:uncharacterized protein LOC128103335 isoform X1 [Peromyscus californicus insignis]|uniref:uncharacterized protein LOC128103335 isoform X1 n=1 Tax=Peromyscus californicus insignis TaxID=564181 RepID=UPI0022A75345|nr:uncharacterized protein LOC128103335 isoform X1 [Peromyscus californicus insignis]
MDELESHAMDTVGKTIILKNIFRVLEDMKGMKEVIMKRILLYILSVLKPLHMTVIFKGKYRYPLSLKKPLLQQMETIRDITTGINEGISRAAQLQHIHQTLGPGVQPCRPSCRPEAGLLKAGLTTTTPLDPVTYKPHPTPQTHQSSETTTTP